MIYLSQILGGRVEDSADNHVGHLKDILIRPEAGTYAPLGFLLVRGKRGREFFVPYDCVENLSRQDISLKFLCSKITPSNPGDDYIYLNRDVMDQQIVDVDGARVVRVNDLRLGAFENKMCVLGVDVSVKGLLRRLGLAWLDFLSLLKVQLIDWRDTQPVKGTLRLDKVSQKLRRLHPADLANIMEDLTILQGTHLVDALDSKEAAKVIEELDPRLQKILVNHLGPERAAKIIEKMSVDEIVDLLQMFSPAQAQDLLSRLQNGKLKKVQRLIEYEEDTAGGLMNAEYVAVGPDWSVEQTVAEVRRLSPQMRSVLFVYVTDARGKFLGPVSLRALLVADRAALLKDLYKPAEELETLHPDDSVEKILEVMTKYNLYTAAVLDDEGRLLGVVAIDDVMRVLRPNA